MPVWEWPFLVLGMCVLLLVCSGVTLILRRRWIGRDGGTFELSYRLHPERPARGWVLGVGRYSADTLEWFRVFSFSTTPTRTWTRRQLVYVSRRFPEGDEREALYADHVIVECTDTINAALIELAMGTSSLTGFQAWIEGAPPESAQIH